MKPAEQGVYYPTLSRVVLFAKSELFEHTTIVLGAFRELQPRATFTEVLELTAGLHPVLLEGLALDRPALRRCLGRLLAMRRTRPATTLGDSVRIELAEAGQ